MRNCGSLALRGLASAFVLAIAGTLVAPALHNQKGLECWPANPAGDLRVLETAVEWYIHCEGRLPNGIEDLMRSNSRGQRYLLCDAVPRDPWGRPYLYCIDDDDTFEIATYGEDGVPGGEGADRDLTLSMVRDGQR